MGGELSMVGVEASSSFLEPLWLAKALFLRVIYLRTLEASAWLCIVCWVRGRWTGW